jgi:biopolymer transport protein ExbB
VCIVRAFELLAQGGFTMIPLVLCSVILVALVAWRCIANRQARCDTRAFLRQLEDEARRHGREIGLASCLRQRKPLARVCAVALDRDDRQGEGLRAVLADEVRREVRQLETGLTSLATIASVAPFIGLLGTVIGVLRAFWHIGLEGKTGAAVVASGVAEALITTAAGLIIAIPAVIAYNALSAWTEVFAEDLEFGAEEIARVAESLPPARPEFLRREAP